MFLCLDQRCSLTAAKAQSLSRQPPSFLQKKGRHFLDLEPKRILEFKQAVVCGLRNVVRVNAVAIANLTLAVIRPGVITNNRKGKNGSGYTQEKVISSSSYLASFRMVSSVGPIVSVRPCVPARGRGLVWATHSPLHSGSSLRGYIRSTSVIATWYVIPKTRARLKPLS